MMGLDVHDMEDLGENYVGYTDTVKRSTQFGRHKLRLARKLEPGFVLTVRAGYLFHIPVDGTVESIRQVRRLHRF